MEIWMSWRRFIEILGVLVLKFVMPLPHFITSTHSALEGEQAIGSSLLIDTPRWYLRRNDLFSVRPVDQSTQRPLRAMAAGKIILYALRKCVYRSASIRAAEAKTFSEPSKESQETKRSALKTRNAEVGRELRSVINVDTRESLSVATLMTDDRKLISQITDGRKLISIALSRALSKEAEPGWMFVATRIALWTLPFHKRDDEGEGEAKLEINEDQELEADSDEKDEMKWESLYKDACLEYAKQMTSKRAPKSIKVIRNKMKEQMKMLNMLNKTTSKQKGK